MFMAANTIAPVVSKTTKNVFSADPPIFISPSPGSRLRPHPDYADFQAARPLEYNWELGSVGKKQLVFHPDSELNALTLKGLHGLAASVVSSGLRKSEFDPRFWMDLHDIVDSIAYKKNPRAARGG
jgi:hypothetical protein